MIFGTQSINTEKASFTYPHQLSVDTIHIIYYAPENRTLAIQKRKEYTLKISLFSNLPMVLKVSSISPLFLIFVSFLGDGGRSASFLPFFLPGDLDLFPEGLPDFLLRSSFFPASAALAACTKFALNQGFH